MNRVEHAPILRKGLFFVIRIQRCSKRPKSKPENRALNSNLQPSWPQELLEGYQRSRLQGTVRSQGGDQRTAELPGHAERSIWTGDALPKLPVLSNIAGLHSLWRKWRTRSLEQEVCAILHHSQPSKSEAGQLTVPESAAKSSASPPRVRQQQVVIVGNGPLADEQRPAIEAADVVIRFNAMHSRCA